MISAQAKSKSAAGHDAAPSGPCGARDGGLSSAQAQRTPAYALAHDTAPALSLFGGAVQAKLAVSRPGDPLEQEADSVADEVLAKRDEEPEVTDEGDGQVQRACAGCEEQEEEQIQRECAECDEQQEEPGDGEAAVQREVSAGVESAEQSGVESSSESSSQTGVESAPQFGGGGGGDDEGDDLGDDFGGSFVPSSFGRELGVGSPLPVASRSFFESRFGRDFGNVRVHTDARAARSARSVGALAYTRGSDIVFGGGQFAPGTAHGDRLLAHELTHVVQQRGAPSVESGRTSHAVSSPTEQSEREADRVAQQLAAGGEAHEVTPAREVKVQRIPITPFAPGGGFGGIMDRDRRRAFDPNQTPAAPAAEAEADERITVYAGSWTFLEPRSTSQRWDSAAAEMNFLTLPIPDLGVMLDITGRAGAGAGFTAGIGPGALNNIRADLSTWQAALVGFGHVELGQPFNINDIPPSQRWLLLTALGDFTARADLDVGAHVAVDLNAFAQLRAAASALGVFDVATITAGLNLTAGAGADLHFGGPISFTSRGGEIGFHFSQKLQAQFRLAVNLNAFITAQLLGFEWTKDWSLLSKELSLVWDIGAPLTIDYGATPSAEMPLDIPNLSVLELIRQALTDTGTDNPESLTALPPPPGGGPGSTTTPPGGPGGPGGPSAPTGRTAGDPIPMTWFKSPGLYPISISLSGERYFLTQPEGVDVPDTAALADVRREADANGQITIGVSPGSRYYPSVGRVWPRVAAGTLRSGTKQAQFRRLLTAHGYSWGSQEADHVRDLQWAGDDAYQNLWPLEHAHNNAANRVLQQNVTYLNDAGLVVTVRLDQTPLNRHFRIIGYS